MEFHTAQLLREPIGSRRQYHVSERCLDDAAGPIEGDVTLLRTDAGILVMASLETAVPITCSRCLSAACTPVVLAVEEEYYPTVDLETGAPMAIPDEETPFLIDQHHILDLREAVRQQLVLAEPMQPLCREDCAGLCPTCGADLNAGPCGCAANGIDPRWAALGGFFETSATQETRRRGE
jgi:uncharacterized protein